MKKSLSLIALILLIGVAASQAQEPRKGYVGLGVGAAFLTGDLKDDCNTGVQFGVDFGYRFTKNVGISAMMFGTNFKSKHNDNSIGLSGFMVGPLLTTAIESGKVEFDLKPLIGLCQGMLYIKNADTERSDMAFSAGADARIRWNCWDRVSLSGGVNYFYGKPEDVDLSSFGITVGVNYRFK